MNLKTFEKRIKKAMANLFFRELELEQHSNKFRSGFFWISKKNRRAETVSAFFFSNALSIEIRFNNGLFD